MVSSITGAMGSITSSYNDALKQMSVSLTRLGTNKRFQTAAEDLGSYLKLKNVQSSKEVMESAKTSINDAQGFLTVAEGYASELVDALNDLKTAAFKRGSAAAGSDEETAAIAEFNGIRTSIDEILDTEYNAQALNVAADTTFETVRMANGGSLDLDIALATDAVVYTNTAWNADYATTAAAIDLQIDKASSFTAKIGGYSAQVDSQESFVNTMVQNLESAESSITEIDEASELSKYTSANIRQQAGVAMIAQANASRMSILNLYT